jgi:hypothetical protein
VAANIADIRQVRAQQISDAVVELVSSVRVLSYESASEFVGALGWLTYSGEVRQTTFCLYLNVLLIFFGASLVKCQNGFAQCCGRHRLESDFGRAKSTCSKRGARWVIAARNALFLILYVVIMAEWHGLYLVFVVGREFTSSQLCCGRASGGTTPWLSGGCANDHDCAEAGPRKYAKNLLLL